jgi:hypothetical protein
MESESAMDGAETRTSAPGPGDRPWPELRTSQTDPCDGQHPETARSCVLGWHNGYHRDAAGVEWLDK